MRRSLLVAMIAAVAALGLLAGACDVEETGEADKAAPAAEEPLPVEDSPPEPAQPRGEFNFVCDYVLDFSDDFSRAGYLVASATTSNTGDVATVERITAIWAQIGSDDVKQTKTVRLRPGQEKTVKFQVEADTATIDRHQSADAECEVRSRIQR